MPEHIEAVLLGELRKLGGGLCNEGGGLFAIAAVVEIQVGELVLRPPALPAALNLAQDPPRIIPDNMD